MRQGKKSDTIWKDAFTFFLGGEAKFYITECFCRPGVELVRLEVIPERCSSVCCYY